MNGYESRDERMQMVDDAVLLLKAIEWKWNLPQARKNHADAVASHAAAVNAYDIHVASVCFDGEDPRTQEEIMAFDANTALMVKIINAAETRVTLANEDIAKILETPEVRAANRIAKFARTRMNKSR